MFCALNIYSYFTTYGLMDAVTHFGWPFDMYAEGGFTGTKRVIWNGLFGNVIAALYVVCVAGIVRTAIKIFGRPSLK